MEFFQHFFNLPSRTILKLYKEEFHQNCHYSKLMYWRKQFKEKLHMFSNNGGGFFLRYISKKCFIDGVRYNVESAYILNTPYFLTRKRNNSGFVSVIQKLWEKHHGKVPPRHSLINVRFDYITPKIEDCYCVPTGVWKHINQYMTSNPEINRLLIAWSMLAQRAHSCHREYKISPDFFRNVSRMYPEGY